MTTVSSSITINQPVEKVFACVIAVENHKAWQTGVLEAKVTPDGPVGVGSTYRPISASEKRAIDSRGFLSYNEIIVSVGTQVFRHLKTGCYCPGSCSTRRF